MPELDNPFGTSTPTPPKRGFVAILATILAVVSLGANFLLFQRLQQATEDVDILTDQVVRISQSVAATEGRLQVLESSPAPGSSPADTAGTAGSTGQFLPRYQSGAPDAAVGLQLAPVTGTWYSDGAEHTIDPADGKARAWIIWAHWCPYCQQELPDVKAWYEQHASSMSNMEVVSITTSIDETRGNPLVPYLETQQFPFPVFVDTTGELAAQFGVSAFPFWVFTGPDGVVLGRTAGLIGPDQMAGLFEQLEAEGANG